MTHADFLDEAAEREQQLIDLALLNRPKPTMTFTGKCHYCEETISKGITAMQAVARTMNACSGRRSRGAWHDAG
ncbi:hypothetical protein O3W44_00280 [Pantoea sp. LMR881]|uniref:hypothetical protein n=1 Tax=Pantoea sp. LMR881 TaxID=3014336 RepID=UPI0022AE86EB|nr:hypothetical protein [Pantoea sp. LMR881]MCZ4057840.1 hypothetical protein [Pantoea sp. LMR881]